jgi:hypothetical protein
VYTFTFDSWKLLRYSYSAFMPMRDALNDRVDMAVVWGAPWDPGAQGLTAALYSGGLRIPGAASWQDH